MRIVLVFVSMLFGLLPALGQEPATKQAYINKSLVRRAFQAMEQGDLKTLNEVFGAKATSILRRERPCSEAAHSRI